MRIRTFLNVQGENKFADLVDWRSVDNKRKSGQKKPSKSDQSRGSRKQKQWDGIVYDEEGSE